MFIENLLKDLNKELSSGGSMTDHNYSYNLNGHDSLVGFLKQSISECENEDDSRQLLIQIDKVIDLVDSRKENYINETITFSACYKLWGKMIERYPKAKKLQEAYTVLSAMKKGIIVIAESKCKKAFGSLSNSNLFYLTVSSLPYSFDQALFCVHLTKVLRGEENYRGSVSALFAFIKQLPHSVITDDRKKECLQDLLDNLLKHNQDNLNPILKRATEYAMDNHAKGLLKRIIKGIHKAPPDEKMNCIYLIALTCLSFGAFAPLMFGSLAIGASLIGGIASASTGVAATAVIAKSTHSLFGAPALKKNAEKLVALQPRPNEL